MTIAAYRVRQGGRYPLTLTEVRLRKPDLGLPAVLTQDEYNLLGVDPVEAVTPPALQDRQTLSEGPPEKVGTAWRQTWIVETLPVVPPTSDDVNEEASRRIAAGFNFQGKRYDYDDKAQKRITGAATLAGFAAGAGAPSGYLLWHGGAEPFAWIAMDNSLTEMDAPTCFAFGQAAAAWESAHVFAGRALKDMQPVPADFADDKWWP